MKKITDVDLEKLMEDLECDSIIVIRKTKDNKSLLVDCRGYTAKEFLTQVSEVVTGVLRQLAEEPKKDGVAT